MNKIFWYQSISGVPFQGYCYFYFINIYMCARVCTRTYSHLRAFVNNNQALVLKFWDHLGSVWYMYLKTENCCLKIFVEIRVGEKMCENA